MSRNGTNVKRGGKAARTVCTKGLSRKVRCIAGTERTQCNCSGYKGREKGEWVPGEATEMKSSIVGPSGILRSSHTQLQNSLVL